MILGIIGFKRSGKDTIADILVDDYKFVKYAYADPIKEIIKVIFGWDDDRIEAKEAIDNFWGISPRQALQNIGTELFQFELGRQVPLFKKTTDRYIWVKVFENWYSQLPEGTNVVVSDIRFFHELKSLHKMKASIIKIERPDSIKQDSHDSEKHINEMGYDFLIANDKDISNLYTQVDRIMDEFL